MVFKFILSLFRRPFCNSAFNGNVMQIFAFLATLGCLCLFFLYGASAVDTVSVSMMVGDEVTLYNNVEINLQDRMRWYFGDDLVALITDVRKICEDDECKKRFKDRLNVDRTGSLTITSIRNTDSGFYKLKILSRKTEKIFNVTVHDEMKRKSVKEGESVTLDPGVMKNTNDEIIMWYYNNTLIAENTGDQSKICTDVQCKERFRDRLKLDHQTGSLTITNTRTTDSGEYRLNISSSRFSIIRNHTITVTDSGSSSDATVWVVVPVLLLLIVAAVVYYKRQSIKTCISRKPNDQQKDAENATDLTVTLMMNHPNGTEAANETSATVHSLNGGINGDYLAS